MAAPIMTVCAAVSGWSFIGIDYHVIIRQISVYHYYLLHAGMMMMMSSSKAHHVVLGRTKADRCYSSKFRVLASTNFPRNVDLSWLLAPSCLTSVACATCLSQYILVHSTLQQTCLPQDSTRPSTSYSRDPPSRVSSWNEPTMCSRYRSVWPEPSVWHKATKLG